MKELLELAIALLIAAQGANVPVDVKNTALQTANLAIQMSMEMPQIEIVETPILPEPEATSTAPVIPLDECFASGKVGGGGPEFCSSGIKDGVYFHKIRP